MQGQGQSSSDLDDLFDILDVQKLMSSNSCSGDVKLEPCDPSEVGSCCAQQPITGPVQSGVDDSYYAQQTIFTNNNNVLYNNSNAMTSLGHNLPIVKQEPTIYQTPYNLEIPTNAVVSRSQHVRPQNLPVTPYYYHSESVIGSEAFHHQHQPINHQTLPQWNGTSYLTPDTPSSYRTLQQSPTYHSNSSIADGTQHMNIHVSRRICLSFP